MTSPTPELPRYFDSTMRSCFRQCPRKFYYEFILGLRPTTVSKDLHAGGCFATAVETVEKFVHEEGLSLEDALQRTLPIYLLEWGDFEPPSSSPKTKDRVWEALEDYYRIYSPLTDHIQPPPKELGHTGNEFTFAIPLEPAGNIQVDPEDSAQLPLGNFPLHPSGEPFLYSGRVDRFGYWRNQKPVGLDHKTTTSISSNWAEKWDLRAQFLGYCWAFQQHDIPVDTIVVRGIGILKTKFHQVEAMKTYSDWEISRWYEQLRRDLWAVRRAWDEGYWDYDLGESCSAYGGCQFQLLDTSPHPENWYSNYEIRKWNPLLKNPITEKEVA